MGISPLKNYGKKATWKTQGRWEDNIKKDLQETMSAWTGLFWVRTGTGGGCL
jgi:hypothetical protein